MGYFISRTHVTSFVFKMTNVMLLHIHAGYAYRTGLTTNMYERNIG